MTDSNSADMAAKIADVRARSGLSAMDCRKALMMHDGDADQAVRWLAEGHWMESKLISWDQQGLTADTQLLREQTGRPEAECRRTLMCAGGNVEIAKQRLDAANHG